MIFYIGFGKFYKLVQRIHRTKEKHDKSMKANLSVSMFFFYFSV